MEDESFELTDADPLSEFLNKETTILSSKSVDLHTRSITDQAKFKSSSSILQHHRSHISKSSITIWLDPKIKESDEDYQHSIAQLLCITKSINTFIHVDECIDFITQIKDEKIFMVISSDLGCSIISIIHEIPQLDSIYVFGTHKSYDGQWAHEWKKVKGIFNQMELVCDLLKQDIRLNEMNFNPFTVLSLAESFEAPTFDELDQSFMYSLLLKEIFLEIEDDDQTKEEFAKFWRLQYPGNNIMLNIINRFEHEYNHHDSIRWYTKESFIYSSVNRALRELEIDIIMKMRFFIRDLHRQIEELHMKLSDEQSTLIVYRGQSISTTVFNKIRKSKGGLLAFSNFLSTSTDRQVSLLFAESSEQNTDLTGVLFRIDVHRMAGAYPYASIKNISDYESEDEILFSMNTIFRIGGVRHIEGRIFEIDLTLTSDNDPQLKILTDHIRQEVGGGTGWHRLGNIMIRLGEFEKAEQIHETLLHSMHDDNPLEMAHLYHQLGFIKKEKGDFLISLSYFQKTVDIQKQYLSLHDPSLAINFNNIGSIHYAMGKYQTALSYYQKALDIQKTSLPFHHSDIAITYSNIGDVYCSMDDYSVALSYYQMTVEIQEKCLPSNDPSLAMTYNCIGIVYKDMEDYETALFYHEKARHIEKKFLPRNHPSYGSTCNNIADVHRKMGNYSTALSLYEEALQIQQESYSIDHISLAATNGKIGGIHEMLGDYANALTFYEKSLTIRQKYLPHDHSGFAVSYSNIGSVYDSLGDYASALLFYQKAVEIEEKIPDVSHSQLATIYNNLGKVYQSMEDYSTALSYYQKTLELRQNSSPLNYPALATIYNNLGLIHDLMNDYSQALVFYQKALEIKQQFLPSNHISLATTYNNIGDVYRSIGDYSAALAYLQKTLAIERNCLSDDHPDLAVTYNNIAKVFHDLHEYQTAVEYAEQAIDIARRALGPVHPDVKLFQDNLSKILEKF